MDYSLKRDAFAAAKTAMPIIIGFLPTGIAFSLYSNSMGVSAFDIIMSSVLVYGGSVQFIAVDLAKSAISYFQFAVIIFLVHSRHLFYGLSVFDTYDKMGKFKPFMIFALSDELYALLTGTSKPKDVNDKSYYLFLAIFAYTAWVIGTAIGAFASKVVTFDTTGADFALTALFLVILTGQIKGSKTKLPFIIGILTGLFSLFVFGEQSMLLAASVLSAVLLIVFRKRIDL